MCNVTQFVQIYNDSEFRAFIKLTIIVQINLQVLFACVWSGCVFLYCNYSTILCILSMAIR